jgi:hypothetical protein
LTFRSGKKHKTQESTKSAKSALKLASRFQHFLTTGSATRKDLKEIDERFKSQFSQQSDRILTMLDQLREVVAGGEAQNLLIQGCEEWARWMAGLDSNESLGYSSVRPGNGESDETLGLLLEGVVDSETNLFQMQFALKASLSSALKNPESLDLRWCQEIARATKDVMAGFQSRQNMLARIVRSKTRQ